MPVRTPSKPCRNPADVQHPGGGSRARPHALHDAQGPPSVWALLAHACVRSFCKFISACGYPLHPLKPLWASLAAEQVSQMAWRGIASWVAYRAPPSGAQREGLALQQRTGRHICLRAQYLFVFSSVPTPQRMRGGREEDRCRDSTWARCAPLVGTQPAPALTGVWSSDAASRVPSPPAVLKQVAQVISVVTLSHKTPEEPHLHVAVITAARRRNGPVPRRLTTCPDDRERCAEKRPELGQPKKPVRFRSPGLPPKASKRPPPLCSANSPHSFSGIFSTAAGYPRRLRDFHSYILHCGGRRVGRT